ncbi:MAG: fructose-1,6-bisphosphatase [Syntrophorhabdaceae bacterium]|nr:fructose-1,6-bisphosphatase [Syntrophorhabdaceae bacterium]MDD4196088.1 fructose-1,6-bisphosphatase [Syntrophorhabdaceae bacterium]HOC46242.1 class 1 fructose-bisphosphatase [Syntrophorhabdaceae bacterium]
MQFEQTFMNFLLEHQERHRRTGHFLVLMDAIISAAKHIEHYYITGALKGYLGRAGWVNIQGEDVMHMDDIAHEIIIHYLKTTGRVIQAVSEESDEVIKLNEDGRYFMYFDPLDGSSNVAHGLPVGFLFGLAKRNLTGDEDFHLRAGREYIAAGMFVIPTGTLTFALRNAGAWRFHIDETFDYVRPTRIFLPDNPKTWELSFNATNRYTYRREVQDWVRDNERKYTFRYMGALAGDFHRILTNGGMFMYPAIVNHPDPKKLRPEGKLRLIYEASVVAFICREAGGHAVNENGIPILDVEPAHHHQRTALYVGSKQLVDNITKVLKA